MIRAVIFDLDGTLLDRETSLRMFVEDQYERYMDRLMVSKTIYVSRFIELDNHGYVWKDKVYQQMNNLKSMGIAAYFDEILISESEGVRKPDKEIFIRALERLNVRAQEAIFVGDHPINDVQASMNAGLVGIWKKDTFYDQDIVADGIIEDLIELQEIIKAHDIEGNCENNSCKWHKEELRR